MSTNGSNIFNTLKITISAMSVSVPILYLVGYYYEQGYLEAFGVNTDYFPRTVQEYLVTAFFAFTNMILKIFTVATEKYYVFFVIAIFVAIISIIIIFLVKKEYEIRKIKENIKSKRLFEYIFLPATMFATTMAIPYLAIFILGTIVVIPIAGYYQGKENAESSIENYFNYSEYGMDDMRRTTIVQEGGKTISKGKFVAKNSHSLAIFDGESTKILSTKDKVIITAKEKKPNKKINRSE